MDTSNDHENASVVIWRTRPGAYVLADLQLHNIQRQAAKTGAQLPINACLRGHE
jgi:hypothetical protein